MCTHVLKKNRTLRPTLIHTPVILPFQHPWLPSHIPHCAHTVGLWETRCLLCMPALYSNLCKDKYLPPFSAVLTNEKFAASCLCCPWRVKGGMLREEGAFPLAIGHRQGLYSSLAWANTPSCDVNENKILKACPQSCTRQGCCWEMVRLDATVAC